MTVAAGPRSESLVHRKHEPCPSWCHFCPHMRGGVMPHCYGSIGAEEDDISNCHCDPSDPLVTHIHFVNHASYARELLRDRRRSRMLNRKAVERIRETATRMQFSGVLGDHIQAWHHVVSQLSLLTPEREPKEPA